jgi:iron(III) transport system permease protein
VAGFRVVLPQLKLAIWGGALLVGLHLLAEYGLYVMIRFDTFTTAIYDQFQSTFSGPAANMLAGVLALCCLGLLLLEGQPAAKLAMPAWGRLRPPSEYPCTRNGRSLLGQLLLVCVVCWRWERPSRCWGAGCGRAAWRSGRTVICGYLCIKRWSWRRPGRSLPLALLSVRVAGGSPSASPVSAAGKHELCGQFTAGIVTALALVTVTIHYAGPFIRPK